MLEDALLADLGQRVESSAPLGLLGFRGLVRV